MNHYERAIENLSRNDLDYHRLAIEFAKKHPASFNRAVITIHGHTGSLAEVAKRMRDEEQNKIAAIKHVRAMRGLSLKEAKEYVESL